MFTHKLAPLACALAWVAPAMGADWITDMDAARQKAAAENKAILASFTGSDWCGACKRLHRDVLGTPEFAEYAKDKFVLLEVDCPHGNKMSEEQKKKNNALARSYRVDGFPTVLVLTPQGDVAGGFLGGGMKRADVQKALDEGLAMLDEAAAIKHKQGPERLEALAAFFSKLPQDIRGCSVGMEDEIISLDKEDKHGFARRRAVAVQRADIATRLNCVRHSNPEELLAVALEYEAQALQENRPAIIQLKLSGLAMMADSLEDLAAAEKTLLKDLETLKGYPEYETVEESIRHAFKAPERLLKEVRAIRAHRAAVEKMKAESKPPAGQ